MAKESKRDVESISVRAAKHASKKVAKAEVNLIADSELTITIDHGFFLLYIISTEDLVYFISIFLLVSWFVLFLAALSLRVRRGWNLMGTSVRNGEKFFILFGKKY